MVNDEKISKAAEKRCFAYLLATQLQELAEVVNDELHQRSRGHDFNAVTELGPLMHQFVVDDEG